MCLGVPGKILAISDEGTLSRHGRVSFAGIVKDVNLAYVPEASVGDYVIVHVGVAISRLQEAEARQVRVSGADGRAERVGCDSWMSIAMRPPPGHSPGRLSA